jgi:hypothetical protein
MYRGNFDTALHEPELASLAATTERVASLPMLVLAGADDGCIPPALFADARRGTLHAPRAARRGSQAGARMVHARRVMTGTEPAVGGHAKTRISTDQAMLHRTARERTDSAIRAVRMRLA